MALNKQAWPSAPVSWPMYFAIFLYRDALGDSRAEEKDLPEKDLFVLVGKSAENGTVIRSSESISGIGIVMSTVNSMSEIINLSFWLLTEV